MEESNYQKDESQYLVDGFSFGFDLHYMGPTNRQDTSRNLPFHVGNHEELWSKIMKEVKLGRFAGPFKEIPYKNYVQSPVGLVPKVGGKTRLIFHLSYDFKESGYKSINHYTPQELCTVQYKDLDHAVKQSLRLINSIVADSQTGCKLKPIIWYGKADLEWAFRLLPLKPELFWLLVIKAVNPIMGEECFFIDKCLPIGHRISCAMFQRFSDALAHIVRFLLMKRRGIQYTPLTNYLDDFLFASLIKKAV